MKDKGFTLAEVLICLGIIGVTAALTLPAMVNMQQEAAIGPKLAKAQASVEDALGRVMIDNIDKTLVELAGSSPSTNLKNKVSQYIIGFGKDVMKDGSGMKFLSSEGHSFSAAEGTELVVLEVDIDGYTKGQNKIGVDKFKFGVTNYGVVVPVGCAKTIAENGWKIPDKYSPSNTGTCIKK